MATTEPLTGANVPQQTDAPLGGQQIGLAVTQLASFVGTRFATTSARDAAWSAWSVNNSNAPIPNGVHCWCDNPGYFYDRIGSAWVARRAPDLINGFAPISGSLPAAFIPQLQAGTASVVTNASAVGSFAWPVDFPAGVLTVQLTALSDTVTQLRIVDSGGTTTSTCQFVARKTDGTPAVSTTVKLTYLAIGW